MKRRILSIFLCLCMWGTLLPGAVWGIEEAPVISQHPQNFNMESGGDAVFSVTAQADAYQWFALNARVEQANLWAKDENGFWQSQIAGKDGGEATFSFNFTIAEGESFSFLWRVSSEGGYDKLRYLVSGTELTDSISGTAMAQPEQVTLEGLAAGSYTIIFTYKKDGSGADGEDCGWVLPYGVQVANGQGPELTVAEDSALYFDGSQFACLVETGGAALLSDWAYIGREHRVVFDLNCDGATGQPAEQTVFTGGFAEAPEAPSCEGITFVGWGNQDMTKQWRFDTDAVFEDTTLYAAWVKTDMETVQDLAAFAAYVNNGGVTQGLQYTLKSNLDFTGFENWAPIGTQAAPFAGTFDGGGFCIDNLAVAGEVAALFGYAAETAVIKNLTVGSASTMTGATGAAGVVVENHGTVEGCENRAAINGGEQGAAGGIAVYNAGLISNCINSGQISGELSRIAGIAPIDRGEITGCENRGTLVLSDYVVSDNGVMAYRSDDVLNVNLMGFYHDKWLQTSYGNYGFEPQFDGNDFSVEVTPSFANKGNYVQLSYQVKAKHDVEGGKFGLYTDVQIGENDAAPISIIYDTEGDGKKPIGFKMADDDEDNESFGAQFNLYFADTYGVTDATSYWFGAYSGHSDHYFSSLRTVLEGLSWSEDGENPGNWQTRLNSGTYTWNEAEDLVFHGDSALSVSWQDLNLLEGQTQTFSILVGVGTAAKAPVAKSLTYDVANNEVSFTVTDENAVMDGDIITNPLSIYASIDNAAQMEPADLTVRAGEGENEFVYCFSLPEDSLTGWHTFRVWGMSDAGILTSTLKTNFSNWNVPTYTVSGSGSLGEGEVQSLAGSTVTLKRGSTIYDQATVADDGSFVLAETPAGTYNLVFETPDGKIITQTVVVPGKDVIIEEPITVPENGATNSVVEAKPGMPELVVSGLDKLFARVDDTVYTQADKDVVDAGGTVELRLVADKTEEADVPEQALSAITQAAEGSDGLYFLDLSVIKTITVNGQTQGHSQLLRDVTLPGMLKIYISLPDELMGKRNLKVCRYHNGAAEVLRETPNADGEYMEISGRTLTVCANKFSPYAISYENPPKSSGNSSATYYTITALAGKGGSISPDGETQVRRGFSYSFDITPDEGYEISDVLVDGKSIGAEESYEFTDVRKNHTIEAAFEKTAGEEPGPQPTGEPEEPTEPDEKTHQPYLDGYGDFTFGPDQPLTRAQAAAIFAKTSADSNEDATQIAAFSDVDNAAWYAPYVAFAASKGLVRGYEDGTFAPETTITRAELAVIIARQMALPEGKASFADMQGHWAQEEVAALAATGYVSGFEDGTFGPDLPVTRAQAVKMVNAMLGRTPLPGKLTKPMPFIDVAPWHWAYDEILEASVSHDAKDCK